MCESMCECECVCLRVCMCVCVKRAYTCARKRADSVRATESKNRSILHPGDTRGKTSHLFPRQKIKPRANLIHRFFPLCFHFPHPIIQIQLVKPLMLSLLQVTTLRFRIWKGLIRLPLKLFRKLNCQKLLLDLSELQITCMLHFTFKSPSGSFCKSLASVIGIDSQGTNMLMNNILKCIRCWKLLDLGGEEKTATMQKKWKCFDRKKERNRYYTEWRFTSVFLFQQRFLHFFSTWSNFQLE